MIILEVGGMWVNVNANKIIKDKPIVPTYVTSPTTFVNTHLFCEEAIRFSKTGKYCDAPRGTRVWNEYWDEQDDRCRNGYTVAGIRITGEHYAYLNFGRIKITIGEGKKARKYEGFPRFLDMDFYYYHELEQAKINKEGMIVAKTRRRGFSYKGGFNCAYEYNWHRDSFSIIGAFMGDYCQATMNMALDMINFLNKHTDWSKRKLIDTRTHIMSGFKETINNTTVNSGYKSEIMTMSFKDNPFKSIGKSGSIMLFEEAGKWPGLIDAYTLSKPLFSDGEVMIGIPIIYGTGGDMENGTQDFCEMFYNPRAYGLRTYQNVWDESAIGECGWFVPEEWYRLPYVDENGNSNREGARKANTASREIIKKSGTKRAYDKTVSQHPNTPAEAFLRTTGNRFPTSDLLARLSRLEADSRIQDADFIGDLVINELGKVEWKLNPKLRPIKQFPLKSDDDTEGCIVIFEHPQTEGYGEQVQYNRYLSSCDPYSQDTSQTDSLGSCFVYDRLTKRIVAEYTARPETANEYYENVRRLLLYYNAVCLYENQVPGLFQYLEGKNQTYLLMDQPEYLKDIIKESRVTRPKGMHMTDGLKEHGEDLVNAWLREQYDSDPDISNLHKIRSIPLLKELISYDAENNFDRVIALIVLMYACQEKKRIRVEETEKISKNFLNSGFFSREINWKPKIYKR